MTTKVPAVGPPELAALGHYVDQMRARIIRELTESVRAREALEQNAAVVLALRKLLEPEPTLPGNREERYSIAVLEMHVQSFHASPSLPALANERDEQRQLEGPAVEASEAA